MKKITLFLVLLLTVLSAGVAKADYQPVIQSSQEYTAKSDPYQVRDNKCSNCSSEIDEIFLDRAIKHEELVDGDIDRFFGLVNQVIDLSKWLLGGSIIALITAFLTFLWRVSRAVKTAVDQKISEMDLTPLVKSSANKIISTRLGLSNRISIYAAARSAKKQAKVFSYLNSSGFTNIGLTEDMSKTLAADLIIFVYEEDLEDDLRELLIMLAQSGGSVPVLVYAERVRVNNGMLLESGYEYVTLANNLLTLASWTLTISSNTRSTKGTA